MHTALRPLRRRYFTSPDVPFRYSAGSPGPTTTRQTPATYRDRTGIVRTAAPGVLRLDWRDGRPYTLTEPGATNDAVDNTALSGPSWGINGLGSVAPIDDDNVPHAHRLTGGASGVQQIQQARSGGECRLAVLLARAGTHHIAAIGGSTTASRYSCYDLHAGEVIRVGAGHEAAGMEALGGGWWLCWAYRGDAPNANAGSPGELFGFGDEAGRLVGGGAEGLTLDIALPTRVVDEDLRYPIMPIVSGPSPTTQDRDLVSVDYAHAPGSLAVLTAGIEAGLGRVGQAHEWQIGASTDLDARALRIRRDGSEETLRLWLGSGSARVQSAVPVVPMGAEYLRLGVLDVQGTEARVRLMQRHREPGGAWVDADGGWSPWLDVSELLASGWESPHLTIGNVREGTRAGRLVLSDMVALDIAGLDAERITIEPIARRFGL